MAKIYYKVKVYNFNYRKFRRLTRPAWKNLICDVSIEGYE